MKNTPYIFIETIKVITFLIFVVIALAVVIGAIVEGFERQERFECHKLAIYAEELPGFYITQWQFEMCDNYSIDISAPVIEN